MPQYVKVGKEGSLKAGQAKRVFFRDFRIAVFNDDGILRAVDDSCTHVGGFLSEGSCEGGVVTCPWHGARFRLCDGEGLGAPAYRKLRTYSVRIINGFVEIEIDD